MSKFESVKRATVGNLVKSDAAGDGVWIVGRITASDTKKGTITYAPADGTEEILIKREHAYKATQEEFNTQAGVPNKPKPLTAAEFEELVTPKKRDTEEVLLSDIQHAPRRVHTTINGNKWTSDGSDLTEEELAEDDGKEKPLSRVKDYIEKYDVVIAASGKKSRDTGDAVAKDLRGMTLVDTYKRVASILDTDVTELVNKYNHLNEGQQRMCLGNRLRGHYRRLARAEEEAGDA